MSEEEEEPHIYQNSSCHYRRGRSRFGRFSQLNIQDGRDVNATQSVTTIWRLVRLGRGATCHLFENDFHECFCQLHLVTGSTSEEDQSQSIYHNLLRVFQSLSRSNGTSQNLPVLLSLRRIVGVPHAIAAALRFNFTRGRLLGVSVPYLLPPSIQVASFLCALCPSPKGPRGPRQGNLSGLSSHIRPATPRKGLFLLTSLPMRTSYVVRGNKIGRLQI